MLFSILSLDSCNLLKTLSREDAAVARKLMIKLIMATDMARHGELVNSFNKIATEFSFEDESHRHLVIVALT